MPFSFIYAYSFSYVLDISIGRFIILISIRNTIRGRSFILISVILVFKFGIFLSVISYVCRRHN